MSIPPVPISPDDDPAAEVSLSGNHAKIGQPYGITAIMSGFVVMLILRAVMHPGRVLLMAPVIVAIMAYLALTAVKPRLPLYALAVIAAELGLLLCMPARMVYQMNRLAPQGFLVLIWSLIFAGATGLLLGYVLKVEEYPYYVLPLNFLALFVATSFGLMFLH